VRRSLLAKAGKDGTKHSIGAIGAITKGRLHENISRFKESNGSGHKMEGR
jgi:hypothetical protein